LFTLPSFFNSTPSPIFLKIQQKPFTFFSFTTEQQQQQQQQQQKQKQKQEK
jgi:hypothetical protein